MKYGRFKKGDVVVINFNPQPEPKLGKVLSVTPRYYPKDCSTPVGYNDGDRFGDLVEVAHISIAIDLNSYKVSRRKTVYDEEHLLTLQELWEWQNRLRAIEGRILMDFARSES